MLLKNVQSPEDNNKNVILPKKLNFHSLSLKTNLLSRHTKNFYFRNNEINFVFDFVTSLSVIVFLAVKQFFWSFINRKKIAFVVKIIHQNKVDRFHRHSNANNKFA